MQASPTGESDQEKGAKNENEAGYGAARQLPPPPGRPWPPAARAPFSQLSPQLPRPACPGHPLSPHVSSATASVQAVGNFCLIDYMSSVLIEESYIHIVYN